MLTPAPSTTPTGLAWPIPLGPSSVVEASSSSATQGWQDTTLTHRFGEGEIKVRIAPTEVGGTALSLTIRERNMWLDGQVEQGRATWSLRCYSWRVRPSDDLEPLLAEGARAQISLLHRMCQVLPDELLPSPGASSCADALGRAVREAPQIAVAPDAVRERLRDALGAMAQGIAAERGNAAQRRAEQADERRKARQFIALPVGTILVRERLGVVAIVTVPGQGNRLPELQMREPSGMVMACRATRYRRCGLRLLTPERHRRMPPCALSNHEVLRALGQARALGATCPDLL